MYIENYTFLLDIKLIVMTVRIMLKKESTEGFDVSEDTEKQARKYIEEIKSKKSGE